MRRFSLAAIPAAAMLVLGASPGLAGSSQPVVSVEEVQALIADNTAFAATDPNPASPDISVSFFVGAVGPMHPGQGFWTDQVSNDSDPYSMQLFVPEGGTPADGFSSFAGINFHHITGRPAPAMSPTFDFMADKSGASGGSPRLVVQFSSPPNTTLYIDLRPDAWTAGTWTTEGVVPHQNDWDLMNQGDALCPGFGTGLTYAEAISIIQTCDPGALVTASFIVTDSGWTGAAPYNNWIDNIQYNGVTISQPSDNSK